jgi:hypothetical protein
MEELRKRGYLNYGWFVLDLREIKITAKKFMIDIRPHRPSGLRGHCFWVWKQ